MAASDAATAIINSIKVAAHEHPPGISKKPVYDISTFLPFSDDVYRLNGSIDYELAVKEKKKLLNHVPVYFKVIMVSGQAGSGKSRLVNALCNATDCIVTAKKNETARLINNAVSSYNLLPPYTISKYKKMKTALHGNFYIPPDNLSTFADCQLSAMLCDMVNFVDQFRNIKNDIEKIKRSISNHWKVSSRVNDLRSANPQKHSTSRKRKMVYDDSQTSSSNSTNDDLTFHPEWTTLADVTNGDKEVLEFIAGMNNLTIPHLVRSNVIIIDEAGMENWFSVHTLMALHQYACQEMGMYRDKYPVLVLIGSESQSMAIRTDHTQPHTNKTTSDVDMLRHVQTPVIKRMVGLENPERMFMVCINKRSSIQELAPLFNDLYMGLKNPVNARILDQFVVPSSYIDDPNTELQRLKDYGDTYKGLKLSLPIDTNKVDFRDYVRIFAGSKDVQTYHNKCLETLPSKKLTTTVFLNTLEFSEFHEHCRELKSKGEMKSLYRENLDDFTLNWLKHTKYPDGRYVEDPKKMKDGLFELQDEYWPEFDMKNRPVNHIKNPLTDGNFVNDLGGEVEPTDPIRYKNKSILLKMSEYRKIPQQYQIYTDNSSGILIGKKAFCCRDSRFFITGFRGTLKLFVTETISMLLVKYQRNSSGFILKLLQKCYGFMKDYYFARTGKRVEHDEDDPIGQRLGREEENKATDAAASSCTWDEGGAYVDQSYDWTKTDCRYSPRGSHNTLAMAVHDLKGLYDRLCVSLPEICEQLIELYFSKNMAIDNASLREIKWYEMIQDRLSSSCGVITLNWIDIPLNGQYVETSNYRSMLSVMCASCVAGQFDVQGVVVECEDSGLVGIVLPYMEELILGPFCLLSILRTPLISMVSKTIASSQGQTFENVAIKVTKPMYGTQFLMYVSSSRSKKNLVVSANPLPDCQYVPQENILNTMLHKGTCHVL